MAAVVQQSVFLVIQQSDFLRGREGGGKAVPSRFSKMKKRKELVDIPTGRVSGQTGRVSGRAKRVNYAALNAEATDHSVDFVEATEHATLHVEASNHSNEDKIDYPRQQQCLLKLFVSVINAGVVTPFHNNRGGIFAYVVISSCCCYASAP